MSRHRIYWKLAAIVATVTAFATLIVPIAVREPADEFGSVSTQCYYNVYSNPSRAFVWCNPGSAANWFRARGNCSNGSHPLGAWQSQPGPWYGSTATCLYGSVMLSAGAVFA